jgi:CheY-like chemotaxis protein
MYKVQKMLTILIIDDSKFNRRLVSKMIGVDAEILEASNGREALHLMQDRLPDCILLDLMMPEMGGVEFLQILHDEGISIPVIILTADIQSQTQQLCIELGAIRVLHKPVQRSEVQQAVQEALR